MNGSMTAHCSSESQNSPAIATSVLENGGSDSQTIAPATPWFGSNPRAWRKLKEVMRGLKMLVNYCESSVK